MAAAIIVPLVILIVIRACWPRAATGARLAAFGAGFLVLWLMIALVSLIPVLYRRFKRREAGKASR